MIAPCPPPLTPVAGLSNHAAVAGVSQAILGLSLSMPGVAPLVMNLVMSISEKATNTIMNSKRAPDGWQDEYVSARGRGVTV